MRRFSAKSSVVNKLVNVLQPSPCEARETKLAEFFAIYNKQMGAATCSNIISDVISHLAIQTPENTALWTFESKGKAHPMLTYNDVYRQSCQLANVLTGKQYNLKQGQAVLVILPHTMKERFLLLLACLQTGLVFCPYDPKELTEIGISQRIRQLTIDCIITDEDNLEMVRHCTYNPLRPLTKGVIMKGSGSELTPVSWNHLIQTANSLDSQYTKMVNTNPNMPVMRFLSNKQNVIQYSQEYLSTRLIITALWLSKYKVPNLVWMTNRTDIMSMAPWLFGSSIFCFESENLKTMFDTLKNYPIDAFCAPQVNYRMLEDEQQQEEHKTQLQQLFSFEPISADLKAQWLSLTNLTIHDDYAAFNNESKLKYFPNNAHQMADHDFEEFEQQIN
ncbi:unnamed protein product [Rotaria magnacalcarata]|uniref:medium-chain acyl-CoA ligase n=1 Tax=Rotaria magnacalcarata TaxID=392030 RepID=A0A820EZW8_9BILA|nr:unnamed protein product [Rotaria magnacalcarata]CAF2193959.1 unnamed protein product [Rotaria magnacalcarata]CAF4226370.1 unnamed protein product [Rotaria magnacalcarata]CAF4254311.1 unnamed protein product [Rotaria magnacalcarata]